MQCVPCSVGKHVDCVVDNNTSLMREPCSCAKHHGERVRKIKRRKRRR